MNPVKGAISQDFGPTSNTNEPTMYGQKDAQGWYRCRATNFTGARGPFADFHPAIDVACPVGTPVRAPFDGTLVRRNSYRIYNPYKKQYVIGLAIYFVFDAPHGGARLMYVDHLSGYVAKEGQKVLKGGLLARTGNSGLSSGPHAHIETRANADPHYDATGFRMNPERVF